MRANDLPVGVLNTLRRGTVIPAHPLALDAGRKFDERRQRCLTRYYIDAGARGLAVGVHSTQFEIRDPGVALFEPVLELASATIDSYGAGRDIVKIAGVCGQTDQAAREAAFARGCGYHIGLLSLAALKDATVPELVAHCRAIADIIPVCGFYLQTAVGGRILPYAFWRAFAEIDNVVAVKMAPFDRYRTLDVVRAVCDAGREKEIALYTGNDDSIVADLLTEYRVQTAAGERRVRIAGGLLGHWSVWTRRAVELLDEIHAVIDRNAGIPPELLTRGVQVTDANAAFFDPAHGYAGLLAGINEVLRRQGLLQGIWCLDRSRKLSPGQAAEIDRVHAAYPHLDDDEFVREHLDKWLS